jgi:hypothetical protein
MPSRIVITSKRDPKVTLEYSSPKSSVSFADLKASSFLDADSPHKWLYDAYAFSDAPAVGYSKILGRYEESVGVFVEATPESFSFTDNHASSFGKATADTFGFSESVLTQITFFRTFTDAFGLDDITAVDAIIKDVASAKTNLFGFSDDQAIGVGKGLTDTFSVSEAIDSFGIGKGLSDSQLITESLDRTVQYSRDLTDTFSVSEAIDSFGIGKGFSDSQLITESLDRTVQYSRDLTDTFPVSEAIDSFNIGKGCLTLSPLLNLTRSVQYSRDFTDAFVLDDAATVDALQKATSALKQNIFGMGDVFGRTVVFNREFTDSVTPTENYASSFSKAAADDSFNVSESLSRVVIYSRAFADAQSFSDAVETTDVGKGIADTQVMTEAHAAATSLAKSDSFSMAEAASSLLLSL